MTTFGSMSGRSTNKFNKIISFLTQKLIDSETSNRQIFDSGENNLPENIDIFDIEMERDLGTHSNLKQNDNIYRMVEGASWQKNLRLWVKFENAAYLYDHARNNNVTEVSGLGQIPILMNKKVVDNVIGWEFHSLFNGQDQFAYTKDNPEIQIAPMFANAAITHISFMDSFNPVRIGKQYNTDVSVLFTKVDDDQLKDGYAATMNDKGDLFFYIRRNFKQYSLFMKGVYAAQLADELANGGNYSAVNFNPEDYNTDLYYVRDLICGITKSNDHWFLYNKSNHNMKFILNGVTQFQSIDAFTVDPILDVPFQDGAYNTDGTDRTVINDISGNNYNGTLTNPTNGQWQSDNTYFTFGSNTAGNGGGNVITFPTIPALDSANEFTISFMYKPDTITNEKAYTTWIVDKNYSSNSSFVIFRSPGLASLRVDFKDSAGVFDNLTFNNAFPVPNEWYSVILKMKAGEAISLTINGVTVTGSTLPANINTGGVLRVNRVNTSDRGTLCLLKVFTTKLGTADTQRIIDEGYHNPSFPKAEKPQPVPDPTPPAVVMPFISFYNLAYTNSTSESNVVWLNSVAGAAPFNEIYNVADGADSGNPELLKYDVPDGISTGGGVVEFTEIYTCTDPDNNSSSQLSGNSGNTRSVVELQTGSTLIGKKVTKAIFFLKGVNTPTGTVRCKIWNAAGTQITELHYNNNSAAPLNAADVNTSTSTGYTFQNTDLTPWGANSLAVGWKIGIEYNNGGSSDDEIQVKRNRSNPKANEWNNNYDGAWDTTVDDDDLVGNLFEGGTGSPVVDPWFELGSGGITTVAESFGSTAHNLLNLVPTKVVLRLKKTGTPSGTFTVNMMNSAGTPLANSTFSGPNTANSLTTAFADYTFTLLTNTNTITNGVQIAVSYGGTGGKVCVMSNKGNTTAANPNNTGGTNNYHAATSYLRRYQGSFTNETTLDVSMKVYTGGDSFDADLSFSPTLTRIYERVMTTDSSLHNKKLTKAIFRLKKVGTPTGLITCLVRKPDDTVRFTIQSLDVSSSLSASYADVTFTNLFNTIQTELNDRICIEYLNSDASNYVQCLTNKDVFETTKTIAGTYSAPVYSDNAQRDISGKIYTGGEPDLNSRIRCAQKIMTNTSIMDGKKLSKITVYLKNPNAVTGNIHCIVYRGSDDQPIVTIETKPASGVGTGWTATTFENVNNGYVLDQNDKVAIVFEGGSTTQRIGVNVKASSTYDGSNSHVVRYNGNTYDDITTSDLSGTMWYGGNTVQPEPNAIPDPTPTNNKDLLFCAGNNLLSGFARLLMREFRIYTEDTTDAQATQIYENRYSKTTRSPAEVLLSGIYKPF